MAEQRPFFETAEWLAIVGSKQTWPLYLILSVGPDSDAPSLNMILVLRNVSTRTQVVAFILLPEQLPRLARHCHRSLRPS